MKKAVFLTAVLIVNGLCSAAHAVTLEQGWYVKIHMVDRYWTDPLGNERSSGAAFGTSAYGTHGPFLVTDGGYYGYRSVFLSVPTTVSGVTAEESQKWYFGFTNGTIGQRIDYILWSVDTNYDPSHMYLSLWHETPSGQRQMMASQQTNQGTYRWYGYTAAGMIEDGGSWYFKVQVVPEPSALTGLLVGLASLVGAAKRGRRRW